MQQVATTRAFLHRLRPWVGRAVHVRWGRRRSIYQSELDALLEALHGEGGRVTHGLGLRVEGFLGRLHREWFPESWRPHPTYNQVLADFRWWLGVAEGWHAAPPRAARPHGKREPLANQPEELCRILGLKKDCTAKEFAARWRVYLKKNHPDLNPGQTREERRRFAVAVAMRRRHGNGATTRRRKAE